MDDRFAQTSARWSSWPEPPHQCDTFDRAPERCPHPCSRHHVLCARCGRRQDYCANDDGLDLVECVRSALPLEPGMACRREHADRPGVLATHTNRLTGTVVNIIDVQLAGHAFAAEPRRWLVECVEHDSVDALATIVEARRAASNPQRWCPDCRGQSGPNLGGAGRWPSS